MLKLTTTTFALLGLLALKPMSAYDLAREMRRNLRYFWPRAERGVYSQVKKLAAAGLASEKTETKSARRRTVYAITPTGRARLDSWLATPPAIFALEAEPLLRLMFASLGATDQVVRAIEQARANADELLDTAVRVRAAYRAGEAPFQALAPSRVHLYLFLVGYAQFVRDWTERTIPLIDAWEKLSPRERQKRALALFEASPARPLATRAVRRRR